MYLTHTHNIVNWLQKALELTLQNHYSSTHLRNVVFHIDFTSSKQHSDTHTHTHQSNRSTELPGAREFW